MHDLTIPEDLVPVAVETLQPHAVLEFNLYLRAGAEPSPVLFREGHFPIRPGDLTALAERGVETLYIASHESAAYERYLREHVLASPGLAPAAHLRALRGVCRTGFLEAWRSRSPARLVEHALPMAEQIVDVVCDDELILADLFAVLEHDRCTFTHAANVCIYSVALADALGVKQREPLTKIAVGALLHDIGKRNVPPAILNKPGKLTSRELLIVRKHPRDGFAELASRSDLEWGQLMMAYQHHERPDGGGYPVGVEQDEIHPWAALCSVVDVFDALTCERPYRRAASVGEALGYLLAKAGRQFNSEIVKCWIRTATCRR